MGYVGGAERRQQGQGEGRPSQEADEEGRSGRTVAAEVTRACINFWQPPRGNSGGFFYFQRGFDG
ncbi:hypothetical protein BVI1335_320084 [Burkholderia vietnamiensis]|nr:hypothetical protein BVI1335_320084 [Burkholderia vietnamiensis]